MTDSPTETVLDGVRTPVDRVAARVIKGGWHWDKPACGTEVCSADPLPTMQINDPGCAGIQGLRFGYMRVVGFSAVRKKTWVCRCDCGRYTLRSAKAIRNKENTHDCCVRCRQKMFVARRELYFKSGRDVSWNELPGYEKNDKRDSK